jgi:hypothetical protein
MARPPLPFAMLVALFLGAWTHLSASTTRTDDLADLCQQAERICEVEVLARESVALADGSIETRYTLATLLPMKGTMSSVQEIRIPGGASGARGLAIPGMPQLQVGERHILFLSAEGQKQWRVPVGLEAGTFRVQNAPGGNAAQVIGAANCCEQDGPSLQVQPYDHFVQRIFEELR